MFERYKTLIFGFLVEIQYLEDVFRSQIQVNLDELHGVCMCYLGYEGGCAFQLEKKKTQTIHSIFRGLKSSEQTTNVSFLECGATYFIGMWHLVEMV